MTFLKSKWFICRSTSKRRRVIYVVCRREEEEEGGGRRKGWGRGGGEEQREWSHPTPHPEWDVLAACMFGAPAVTNCVDAVDKKIGQGAFRNTELWKKNPKIFTRLLLFFCFLFFVFVTAPTLFSKQVSITCTASLKLTQLFFFFKEKDLRWLFHWMALKWQPLPPCCAPPPTLMRFSLSSRSSL